MNYSAALSELNRWEHRVMRAAHPLAYPALSMIRKPVIRVPGFGVIVTDATLLREVLLNTQSYSKIGRGAPSDIWTPLLGARVLLNMEGDEHRIMRQRLAPLFAPGFVRGLVEESLSAPTNSLTQRLLEGQTVDIVAEARRYASIAISKLVGLRNGAVDDAFFRKVNSITSFVTLGRPRLSPPQLERARSVMSELNEHAIRAYESGDDSTVPGRMRALGLSRDEALGAVGAFVVTGTETLVAFIPRMLCLLLDSGWLHRVAENPELLEPVIAEALRITTPSPVMLRSAVSDSWLGSVHVHSGDRVVLGTYWANRAAGGFDPQSGRSESLKRLWFGAGPHFCIGAPLAMAQIRMVMGAVMTATASGPLRIVSREPARRVLVPGYRRVLIGE